MDSACLGPDLGGRGHVTSLGVSMCVDPVLAGIVRRLRTCQDAVHASATVIYAGCWADSDGVLALDWQERMQMILPDGG